MQRILDSGDKAAIDIANEIDADLVELGEGLIDEVTLREHLQSYVGISETIESVFYDTEPSGAVLATTAVETIRSQVEIPGPVVVDIHLDLVFA